jgi:uncharacterized membrane protein SirB2
MAYIRRPIYHAHSFLGICAGLLYSSWPLGYWLNSRVAHSSLASGLEATGQPFNWLFISTDIMSSLLLVIISVLLWQKYRYGRLARLMGIGLAAIMLFAVTTIIDALLPEHCVPNLMRCASFTEDHYLLVHGIFSIAASIFLFVSLCVVWFCRRQERLLQVLLTGYIVFAAISLVEAITPGKNGNWSEYYYISLCSIWIACIPYAFGLLTNRDTSKVQSKQD